MNASLPKARIVLLEDEPKLRQVLTALLTNAGYAVHPAADGREATALLQPAACDLLVTDLIMPGREGIETILAARRARPQLPIIAMTGGGHFPAELYLGLARTAGANQVLEKPFEFGELLAAVEALLPVAALVPDESP